MTFYTKPTDPSKPTAWIRGLDLKSGREEQIAMLKQQVDDLNSYQGLHTPYRTANVTKPIIKRFKKWLKPLAEKSPVKLNVIPVGGICLCHNNAIDAIDRLTFLKCSGLPFTFRRAIGYNLMSCDCGRDLHGEVHSVLYCEENGEYYDITEDMLGETEKWFVECPLLTENYEKIADERGFRGYDMIGATREGCRKCNVRRLGDTYANDSLENLAKAFK